MTSIFPPKNVASHEKADRDEITRIMSRTNDKTPACICSEPKRLYWTVIYHVKLPEDRGILQRISSRTDQPTTRSMDAIDKMFLDQEFTRRRPNQLPEQDSEFNLASDETSFTITEEAPKPEKNQIRF